MATIADLEPFLQACRERSLFSSDLDAVFKACVQSAMANGFGGSDVECLGSNAERRFVLRRQIGEDQVSAHSVAFVKLIKLYRAYSKDHKRFLDGYKDRVEEAKKRKRRRRPDDPILP